MSTHSNKLLAEQKLQQALETTRKHPPRCEACTDDAVALWDSEGEGMFYLCAERDQHHSQEVYSGVLVETLMPNPDFSQAVLESLIECIAIIDGHCTCDSDVGGMCEWCGLLASVRKRLES